MKKLPLCLLLLFSACTNPKSGTDKAVKEDTPLPKPADRFTLPPPSDTLYNWIGAYHKLDDKYDTQKDTALINSWWRQKLLLVEMYGQPENLFNYNGGGPHGAEWNPLTDLYIVVTTKEVLKNEKAELLLNNKPVRTIKLIKQSPAKKTGTIYYAVVPQTAWSAQLRKKTKEDYYFMYGKPAGDSLYLLKDAVYSEVVEITVKLTPEKGEPLLLKGIFQAAYGE